MIVTEYKFEELSENSDNTKSNKNSGEIGNNNTKTQLENLIKKTQKEAQEQAEVIKETAKKEGFETGYKEGLEKGLKEAQEKLNDTIKEYTKKMENAIQKLIETSQNIENKYREIENGATDAILSIASKVIAKKIEEDRNAIISMLKEALGLTQSKKLKIKLNPEDMRNIENNIKDIANNKMVELIDNNNLPKGSIIIEEEDGNIIDAGVDAKLEQIAKSIKNE